MLENGHRDRYSTRRDTEFVGMSHQTDLWHQPARRMCRHKRGQLWNLGADRSKRRVRRVGRADVQTILRRLPRQFSLRDRCSVGGLQRSLNLSAADAHRTLSKRIAAPARERSLIKCANSLSRIYQSVSFQKRCK